MSEKIIRVGTAVLLVNDDGKVLMGKRHGSHGAHTWALIGGYIEFGETFEAAAAREVMEEVGVTIKDIRVLKAVPHFFPETSPTLPAQAGIQCEAKKVSEVYLQGGPQHPLGSAGNNNFKHHISIYMTAKIDQGTPTICEPHKMLELRFVDWNDLPQPLFVPYQEDITVEMVLDH